MNETIIDLCRYDAMSLVVRWHYENGHFCCRLQPKKHNFFRRFLRILLEKIKTFFKKEPSDMVYSDWIHLICTTPTKRKKKENKCKKDPFEIFYWHGTKANRINKIVNAWKTRIKEKKIKVKWTSINIIVTVDSNTQRHKTNAFIFCPTRYLHCFRFSLTQICLQYDKKMFSSFACYWCTKRESHNKH